MKDARDNAKIKNVSAARPFTYDENLQKKLSLKSPNIALSANNICKHFVFSPLTVADNEGENSNKAVENLVMIRSFLPEFGKKMQIEGSKLAYLRVQEVGSTDQRPNYAWCEKAEVILDANFSVNSAVQNEIRLVERNWSQVTRVKDDSCAMM